jgi:fructose-bisphosphate aldolase class I
LNDAEPNLPGHWHEATQRRPVLILENQERLESKMTNTDQQMQKMKSQPGFVAALDQSGGSTPHALELYGIGKDRFSNDEQMYDLVHQMRTRVITSPSFTGDRILAAILFENTMDRDIEKQPTADYLWNVKRVVPILKVDKGLEAEQNGVQLMKSHPQLAALLDKARSKRIFGTKMRSVVKQANPAGIDNIVRQQFEWAGRIIDAGLVPIIEPEVDIHCPQKAKAEELLKAGLLARLGDLPANQKVMLKLTLPDKADFYSDCVSHPKVVRVLALSGGYTQKEADDLLRKNHGVVASFSRALLEGLTAQQTDAEFNAALDASIKAIYEASVT